MSARILVVDDVPLNVKLLEAKLSSEYYDVISASGGPEALAIAEAESPDVVLLDVMMPGMDGFEVCRRLKRNPRTADAPVVMVTALSGTADRVRGLEAGADEFLTKPINDIALFARLRALVRLKRMLEEWRAREEICERLGGAGLVDVAADLRPARIVILDANALAAAEIAETLLPVAPNAVHAATAAEALAKLAEADVLIAALYGRDDGPLRLVSHCRATEALRQLSILLISDRDDLPRLAKGLDVGANDYLLRPVDRNELLARTRTQMRRRRLQERLRENYRRSLALALTDELTGAYNRRFLFAHLEQLLERQRHGGPGPALLVFDIDHFKTVNDRCGHAAGDEVLRQVATRAARVLRDVDLVARLGGDEFVVVLADTALATAVEVAERFCLGIAGERFAVKGNAPGLPVTVSIGVASAIANRDTPDTLLARADEQLYSAKRGGRNRVAAVSAGFRTPEFSLAAK